MAKPPPSGPSSDVDGVNRDARTGTPSRDPAEGGAEARGDAQSQSKGRPKDAGQNAKS